MLLAVIIGSSRSGPGRFCDAVEDSPLALVESTIALPRFLDVTSRATSYGCIFGDFLGIVAVTRKPPLLGIVRMCSYLHYSKFSGGFRAFFEIF